MLCSTSTAFARQRSGRGAPRRASVVRAVGQAQPVLGCHTSNRALRHAHAHPFANTEVGCTVAPGRTSAGAGFSLTGGLSGRMVHTKLDRYIADPRMAPHKNDILQGTLVLLILKTLASHKRLHGYAITGHIQQVSGDLLRVEEGSLYPALRRMEDEGWLRAEWGLTERQREARFYSLTPRGRRQLAHEEASWSKLTEGVDRVLRHA